MLLTLYLRFGDFDFGEIKEYPKNVSVSAMLVDTRQKKYRSSFYS